MRNPEAMLELEDGILVLVEEDGAKDTVPELEILVVVGTELVLVMVEEVEVEPVVVELVLELLAEVFPLGNG